MDLALKYRTEVALLCAPRSEISITHGPWENRGLARGTRLLPLDPMFARPSSFFFHSRSDAIRGIAI